MSETPTPRKSLYEQTLDDYNAVCDAYSKALSGLNSATVTTGNGGSRSWSRASIADLEREKRRLYKKLYKLATGRNLSRPRSMGVRFDG